MKEQRVNDLTEIFTMGFVASAMAKNLKTVPSKSNKSIVKETPKRIKTITRPTATALAEIDAILKEESFVRVYHKGNLPNSRASNTRSLSTGLDKFSVDQIRKGKLYEFKIPQKVYNEWKDNLLVKELRDYDYKTGIYNDEIKFSPKVSEQLNQYIVK